MVEKGFTPIWAGALRLPYSKRQSVCLNGRHFITYLYMDSEAVYNSIAAVKVKISLILAVIKGPNFEMMSQKVGASAIANSDSSLRGERAILFFFTPWLAVPLLLAS